MKEKSMTALVSCFARAYHNKNNEIKIYDDFLAEKILSEEEYENISVNMYNGIKFFNPNFVGSNEEALRYIVDNQLSPSVLGRSAFCERMLNVEINLCCKEYLIYASGYDTSGYKSKLKNVKVFEIDREEMIKDKQKRLNNSSINYSNVNFISCDFTNKNWINNILDSGYDKNAKSFNSLMGISYYLSKDDFSLMIKNISDIITDGSSIIFDYPTYEESKESIVNEKLASESNEEMKSKYTYSQIEKILSDNNLYIYEHLDNNEMTKEYFSEYNNLNQNHKIIAPRGVAYCYAVKKER